MNKYSIKQSVDNKPAELTIYMSYANMPFNLWREISKLCSDAKHYVQDELEPGSSIRMVYIFDEVNSLDSAKKLLEEAKFTEV